MRVLKVSACCQVIFLIFVLNSLPADAENDKPEERPPERTATWPNISLLVQPPDNSTVEGRGILFQWDGRDLQSLASHFRLIVKERSPDQSAQDAMHVNEVRFETVIEHQDFFILNAAELRDQSARYVWRVIAMGEAIGGELREIAASEVRSFQLASVLTHLDRFRSDETPRSSEPEEQAGTVSILESHHGCPNGDLESGTLQGWRVYNGSRSNSSGINLSALTAGVGGPRHRIRSLTDGDDPELPPGALPQVSEGTYSVRLGDSESNAHGDLLAYTFTVNQENKNFSFKYALVLENPLNHSQDEQPFFSYYVLRGSSIFFSFGNFPFAGRQVVADSNNPFFKTQDGIVYRGWTPTCIDLSPYLGQMVTIVFAAADCSRGGHFGYVYLDGLCRNNAAVSSFEMPSEICPTTVLWADGSASTNETSHFWSIEESDAQWGRNPETEVSEWFVAQQAGTMDLTTWYASKGGRFECNKYYRVKLAVSNDCTPWDESVHLLYVKCPSVTAGPNQCVSCTPNGTVAKLGAGNPASPNLTYTWTPAAGLDDPSKPSPDHTQGSVSYPMIYTVEVKDAQGCVNSDQITLYCQAPTVRVRVGHHCCGATLVALGEGHESIEWSTGQSGVSSIDVESPGTYSVTVANACGSTTKSVEIQPTRGMVGFFNPIAANSRFCPPSGASNCEENLHIKDVIAGNGALGVPNAYNATEYKLEIFDRWGILFKTITGSSCDGFPNWSISWDGTNQFGNLVQQDTYVWLLHFKNCQYKNWTLPKERRFVERRCVRWARIFGIKLWCREYNVPPGTTVDEVLTPQGVTLIR